MRNFKQLGQLGLMFAGAAIAIVAYEAGRANAGVPSALVYSGYLTDDTGTPPAGLRDIAVFLYRTEDPSNDDRLCDPSSLPNFDLSKTGGHFSVTLDGDCSTEVQKDGVEPWVEVRVDGVALERSKISAVPYALLADTASTLSQKAIQDLKDDLADPECPHGYTRVDDGVPWTNPDSQTAPEFTVCIKERNGGPYDSVVKVGVGNSAFWIDRYEATLWTAKDGTGMFLKDPPVDFPSNGEIPWIGPLYYALSTKLAVTAPTGGLTWFQAEEACTASGKRLPTGEEWLRAARGTSDPPVASPAMGIDPSDYFGCNTAGPGRKPGHAIGDGVQTSCVSFWGAEDMIGNYSEWTEEWHFPGAASASDENLHAQWPAGFHDDQTDGVGLGAQATSDQGSYVPGLPAVATRGGYYGYGPAIGRYHVNVQFAPTGQWAPVGFRCMIPR